MANFEGREKKKKLYFVSVRHAETIRLPLFRGIYSTLKSAGYHIQIVFNDLTNNNL